MISKMIASNLDLLQKIKGLQKFENKIILIYRKMKIYLLGNHNNMTYKKCKTQIYLYPVDLIKIKMKNNIEFLNDYIDKTVYKTIK